MSKGAEWLSVPICFLVIEHWPFPPVIRTNLIEDLTLVPMPPWWQSPWALAGFVVAAAAVLWALIWLGQRFRPMAAATHLPIPVPDLTPEFLRRLAELRGKRTELSAYELAVACSQILREFLEWRLQLAVTAQTTREFLEATAAKVELSPYAREGLGRYLALCDLVKFARHGATAAEQSHFLDAAEQFVRQSSGGPP